MSACCSPGAGGRGAAPAETRPRQVQRDPREVRRGMVAVKGGSFLMGGEDPDAFSDDGEGPIRRVQLAPFWIDALAVSNREFAKFVKASGYVTSAEESGWSYVFYALVQPEATKLVLDGRVPGAPWWLAVQGACWRAPDGPGSSVATRPNYPVVHVSWLDAQAYAAWVRKRLPTEAEWEMAARGGLEQARFPWGNELTPGGRHRCNVWQGAFPDTNTGEDGYLGPAPVNAYKPNAFGLYNVAGNVWEWCADWWSTTWHVPECPETRVSPQGPPEGQAKVIRGGSYLCHASYCNRYRVAARTSNTPDSSTGNMGFRCAAASAAAGCAAL